MTIQQQITQNRLAIEQMISQAKSIEDLATVPVLNRDNFLLVNRPSDNNKFKLDINNMFSLITQSDVNGLTDTLNNKADLVDGLVPSNQLPAYIDDVVNGQYISTTVFNDLNGDPYDNETGRIYADVVTNPNKLKTYRWSGSVYIEIKDEHAVWGNIDGDINTQLDLIALTDTKANLSGGNNFTGIQTFDKSITINSSDNILANFNSIDNVAEIRISDNIAYTRLLTSGFDFKIMPNNGSEVVVFEGDTLNSIFKGDLIINNTSNSNFIFKSPGGSGNSLIFWEDSANNEDWYLGQTTENGNLLFYNYSVGSTHLNLQTDGSSVFTGSLLSKTFLVNSLNGWMVKSNSSNHGLYYDGTQTILVADGAFGVRFSGSTVSLLNTEVNGILTVTGNSTFNSDITLSGNRTIKTLGGSDNLNINPHGTLYLGTSSTDGITIGALGRNITFGGDIVSDLNIIGSLKVGTPTLSNKLSIDSGIASDIVSFENNNGSIVLSYEGTEASIDLPTSNSFRIRQGGSIPLSISAIGNTTFANKSFHQGGIHISDDNFIQTGDNSDMSIYHSSGVNYINSDIGSLYIRAAGSGNDTILTTELTNGTQHFVVAMYGGVNTFFRAFHNNSNRLETSDAGIKVTASTSGNAQIHLASNNQGTSQDNWYMRVQNSDKDFVIVSNATEVLRLTDSSGNLRILGNGEFQGNIIQGNGGTATGINSNTFGYECDATGNYSFTVGIQCTASELSAIAIGNSNTASASGSIAIGGNNNLAAGASSSASGVHNFARSVGEFSIGRYGTDYTSNSDGTDRLFNVGSGDSTIIRSNAFTVYKNGDADLKGDFKPATVQPKNAYKSSDGTDGVSSGTFTDNNGNTITIKDGIITDLGV